MPTESSRRAAVPTVVVATRNRCDALLETLERLFGLPERPPVVVVDNGSTDRTLAAVRSEYPAAGVISLDRNLGAAARTLGARRATTPLVAFSDDDSWWRPGALLRAASVFARHPSLGLLAARILVEPGGRLDPTSADMGSSAIRGGPRGGGVPVLGFVACGTVVRRTAFLSVGGFHPRFGVGGEEHVVALDLATAGWDLVYRPDIVAHHRPASSRDPARRREVEARNALWSAWLRWPAGDALQVSGALLARSLRDRAVRRGALEAIREGGWVLARRRPVRGRVAAELATLRRRTEPAGPDRGSAARFRLPATGRTQRAGPRAG